MTKPDGLTKDEHTVAEHRFKTADGIHELYVQEWGSPKGAPILFLHGGPGGGCNDGHKKYFDPQKHRAIFLDQRGSGNSKPYGSLKNNTTQHLIEDIELVRRKLGIEKWHVEGASWGSTLALAYAIANSERIKTLTILGVFLGTKEEIEWLSKGFYKNFYPEVYETSKNKNFKYDQESDQIAYLKMILPLLGIDDRQRELPEDGELNLKPTKIELYYLNNNCFLTNDYILNNAHKINVPVRIIQGRYDMLTPPISAYKLSRVLPDCAFHTTLTGHLPSDRESSTALKVALSGLQ